MVTYIRNGNRNDECVNEAISFGQLQELCQKDRFIPDTPMCIRYGTTEGYRGQ